MLNGQTAEGGLAEDVTPATRAGAFRVPAWVFGWALAAVILCAVYGPAVLRLDLLEPDNAMRLVGVRDFLGGEPWFDLTQSRMGLDGGLSMHWARWIDALIAAPIALLSPILGAARAEIVVMFLWPLGLLAAFMALVSAIAAELADDAHKAAASVVGPILAALAFPVMDRFAPGALDHHNVVAVLLVGAVLALVRMDRWPWLGAVAGGLLAASLGAAAEALPMVAAAICGAGLAWILRPKRFERGLFWTGAGLTLGSAAAFLIQVPPARWGVPVCDSMSPAFLGLGLLAGIGAMALARASSFAFANTWRVRLGLSAAVGVSALAIAVVLFPECRGGGYGAVSPEMDTLWMAQIAEARSIFALAGDDIALLFGLCGSALFGLVAMVWALRRNLQHSGLWIVAPMMAVAFAVMVWQVRGATLAAVFAVPFATLMVVRLRAAYRESRAPRALLAFVGAAALSCSAFWSTIGLQVRNVTALKEAIAEFEAANLDARACTSSAAYADLARMPPGLIVNQFGLGPSVLLNTPHSVIAGPYHRNETGTLAAINILRSDASAVEAQVRSIGATYVVVCPASPESAFYAAHAAPGVAGEDTLAARLAKDAPPAWLTRVGKSDGPLLVYRIAGSGVG